ncbi:GPW/gp25 family protein [Nocardia xishanensis]|uniref:GPW/gp25 family protein n=1 Tax=Nocardia xishanensis TaxID=238964 RepID=UPI0034024021
MVADPQAFLGVGWAFPPTLEPNGTPTMVTHSDDVRQAIMIILGTDPGERVMRPDFGAGLSTFVFEPVSPTTMTRIRNQVRDALIDWEPRIDVLDVAVTPDPNERNQLLIDVRYRVRATNSLHNLVYPFYLDEGTPR